MWCHGKTGRQRGAAIQHVAKGQHMNITPVHSTPQGCEGRIRMGNVAASCRVNSAIACRPADGFDDDTPALSSAAQRFALVAKLQMSAIATASIPRPVRSL